MHPLRSRCLQLASARRLASGLARLAQAKEEAAKTAEWPSALRAVLPFVGLAGVGTAGHAFYDGLWVPLLRDGQSAEEAARQAEPLLDAHLAGTALTHLERGEVVVVDGVLSATLLADLQRELQSLASTPGGLLPNPKVQAGNTEVRTDRVCYLRDPASFSPTDEGQVLGGAALQLCHRRLRATALVLETGSQQASRRRTFVVPAWTQLAQYTDGSGFYKWHTDGLGEESGRFGPLGWYFWLQRGAVRRRSITGILYLNEEDWPSTAGGALRCRAAAAPLRGPPLPSTAGIAEVLPKGGRLVLFDSHKIEHEVVATRQDRWALTVWLHE
ncbi:unnamed protein product [Symbiodinium natans]|uniref:Fe2OG dioxygenase domain-containing protein n=1 Tax=Symbiodinium natans TaxID=878477 RepID=A0A812Q485_9DINO|nr:unnamed protein product [Symbiodinium natans]